MEDSSRGIVLLFLIERQNCFRGCLNTKNLVWFEIASLDSSPDQSQSTTRQVPRLISYWWSDQGSLRGFVRWKRRFWTVYFLLSLTNEYLDAAPVILGIRPAHLIDRATLSDVDIASITKSLQKAKNWTFVITWASWLMLGEPEFTYFAIGGRFLHC